MANKYYNEQFKNQYLEDSKSRNLNVDKTVDLLFRRISDTETALNKDLYDFTVTEIIGYYKYLFTPSLESLMIMNNQYKLYTAYALQRGMVKDNQNHYAEIDNKILLTCVHTELAQAKRISRKELLDILKSEDVENVSDKVIALGIFEGILGREMTELTHLEVKNIDTKKKTISLYGGRKLNFSDELINWCIESADEYNYYNRLSEKDNKKYLETDTRVIKRSANSTVDTDHQRHKTINRRLDRLISVTNCNAFTIGALRESGRLEMIKNLMDAGMTLHEALKDKDMLYRYGRIPSIKRYIMKYGLE